MFDGDHDQPLNVAIQAKTLCRNIHHAYGNGVHHNTSVPMMFLWLNVDSSAINNLRLATFGKLMHNSKRDIHSRLSWINKGASCVSCRTHGPFTCIIHYLLALIGCG